MKIFDDIPRCLNHGDDILIGARNWTEQNQTLEQELQSANDFDITLNRVKCHFGRDEIEFYGCKGYYDSPSSSCASPYYFNKATANLPPRVEKWVTAM